MCLQLLEAITCRSLLEDDVDTKESKGLFVPWDPAVLETLKLHRTTNSELSFSSLVIKKIL